MSALVLIVDAEERFARHGSHRGVWFERVPRLVGWLGGRAEKIGLPVDGLRAVFQFPGIQKNGVTVASGPPS